MFDAVMDSMLKSSEQLNWGESNGFRVVQHKVVKRITIKALSDELLTRRSGSNYEIDGIILMDDHVYPKPKSGNPKYALAFKMVLDDQKAETTVVDVTWDISKHGFLKPVVIVSPVMIAGTTIRRATGYNAKWIVENNIGPGAQVILIKSGDIIPKIIKVTTPAKKPMMPPGQGERWEWGAGVDIKVIGKSTEVDKKKILSFMNKLEVEGFKRGTINKVYDAGYDTLPKILAMEVSDYLTIEGIKEKSAVKLHSNLQEAYGKASLPLLLAATNALGEGVGSKRILPLLDAIPNLCEKSCRFGDKKIRTLIGGLDGFSEKMADKIISNRKACVTLLSSMPKRKVSTNEVAVAAPTLDFPITKDVNGMKFVFTGGRLKELEATLVILGAQISGSVSKKTTVLIAKDPTVASGKTKKAQKLGIPIMGHEQFKTWLNS